MRVFVSRNTYSQRRFPKENICVSKGILCFPKKITFVSKDIVYSRWKFNDPQRDVFAL